MIIENRAIKAFEPRRGDIIRLSNTLFNDRKFSSASLQTKQINQQRSLSLPPKFGSACN